MKEFLKNKFFIIFFAFILFMFLGITSSFCAITYPMTEGDVTFENPPVDGNPDFFICEGNFGGIPSYFYYTYDSSVAYLYYKKSSTGSFVFVDKNTNKLSITAHYYRIEKDNLSGSFIDIGTIASMSLGSSITNYYSTKDIYSCTGDGVSGFLSTGTVVFTGAPLPIQGVELMKEIQAPEGILPAIMKIVEMILPVCLIIFGTLLVVYLIKSKNLLQL